MSVRMGLYLSRCYIAGLNLCLAVVYRAVIGRYRIFVAIVAVAVMAIKATAEAMTDRVMMILRLYTR
jgi:hypothetical protein